LEAQVLKQQKSHLWTHKTIVDSLKKVKKTSKLMHHFISVYASMYIEYGLGINELNIN